MNTSAFDQLFSPVAACFTPEVAARVAAVETSKMTQDRLDELRTKANFGTLSNEERAEYEEFVEALDVLYLLKAKARAIATQQQS
jgi:hypothetical protein